MGDPYDASLAWLEARLTAGTSFGAVAQEAVAHLRQTHPDYHWVGIYLVAGERLRLQSWDGPAATEHVDIPLGHGVCGFAAATGEIANVPDVSRDERYLQCFLGTRSELVVPIQANGLVYGEIDVDSDRLEAFRPADERFLASFCDRLATLAARDGLPGRRPSAR